jgi:hypothetical protein
MKAVSLLERCCSLTAKVAVWFHRESPTEPDVDSSSVVATLIASQPPAPSSSSQSASRSLLLSSISQFREEKSMQKVSWKKAAPFAAAGLLFVFGAIGAAAAAGSSPVNDVLGTIGFAHTGDNHGQHVSSGVLQAIESSTPGVSHGELVSAAACSAAHDRSTLPSGAQNAPGQQDKTPVACETATSTPTPDASLTPTPTESPTPTPDASATPTPDASVIPTATLTHGQSVSNAVQDAISSTTPGPERGQAVSEAACTAAHDRTTLPQGAQDAKGQQNKDPKDCTHPNADATSSPQAGTTPEATPDAGGPGNSGTHGPDSSSSSSSPGNSGTHGPDSSSSSSGPGNSGSHSSGNGGGHKP